jgi:hypothetical protein
MLTQLQTDHTRLKYCNVDRQSIAKQRFGKQTSTIRLFSMGSVPRPLLCNGSVNTFQQQRLCFPWGPWKGVILKTNSATIQF